MKTELARLLVQQSDSLREVMARIDRNANGIALVVDGERRLLGTVTDGDVRRAILAGMDLDSAVAVLLERRAAAGEPGPLAAQVGTPDDELLRLMNRYTLRHIPLTDDAGCVVDIALLAELAREYEPPPTAVVMAGGFGTRLRPLTKELPKPMLPVGDRPLLELIIEQLRQAGIHRVNLTTHYKAEVITSHFGNGKDFGVEISYVREDQPLGTAGALALLETAEEPLLVINGDILTRVDFRALMEFHREHAADMTVALRQHEFRIPYGVVETEGVRICSFSEKPVLRPFVNAGIYLLAPAVRRHIPNGRAYNMSDLIHHLLAEGRRVIGFPIREYWLDIGQVADYEKALADMNNGEV